MGNGIGSGGARRRATAMLLAAALGIAATACGDEEPTADTASTAKTATDTGSGDEPGEVARDSEDGRLTTTTGTVITDYGDRGERIAAVRSLDRLQNDFRAGRMAAACRRVNDFMLSQFTPRGTRSETPCPRKLEAYAAARAKRGSRPERLRLLWVRQYTGQTGIWVEDVDGHPLRIQLSNPISSDQWQLDLGSLKRPDLLAADLVGADDYGKR